MHSMIKSRNNPIILADQSQLIIQKFEERIASDRLSKPLHFQSSGNWTWNQHLKVKISHQQKIQPPRRSTHSRAPTSRSRTIWEIKFSSFELNHRSDHQIKQHVKDHFVSHQHRLPRIMEGKISTSSLQLGQTHRQSKSCEREKAIRFLPRNICSWFASDRRTTQTCLQERKEVFIRKEPLEVRGYRSGHTA